MKSWLILLSGLLVWTVHFFSIYAIGEIAPRPIWVIALTFVCAAADIWLLLGIRRLPIDGPFAVWRRSVALGGCLLSLVAVCWQGLAVITA